MLTDSEPPEVRKGRPKTLVRDFHLAIAYLTMKPEAKRTDKLIVELKKKYGLSKRENTFYLAVNRGIKHLERFATYWIDCYRKGEFIDSTEESNEIHEQECLKYLFLIEDYQKKNKTLKKDANKI